MPEEQALVFSTAEVKDRLLDALVADLGNSVGLPDEESMSCQDGLVENHYYIDLRGMVAVDFERALVAEQALLAYPGDLGEDEAMEQFEDNELFIWGLDPGVGSLVFALSVIGACPVTCCNGREGHYETHPLVLFWATQEQTRLVVEVANKVGVILSGVGSGLLLWVRERDELSKMIELAKELVLFQSGVGPDDSAPSNSE